MGRKWGGNKVSERIKTVLAEVSAKLRCGAGRPEGMGRFRWVEAG